MSKGKTGVLTEIVLILVLLQAARFALKSSVFIFVTKTDYSDHMASLFSMTALSIAILITARATHTSLSVFPDRFGSGYIAATAAFTVFAVSTPLITKNCGIQAVTLLFYSSVTTPLFEELIFRGYVWNRLTTVFKSKWSVYAVCTILFALWHLGYVDSIAYRVQSGLANVMFWKVAIGFGFGTVLGALRLRTKNCYSTMLLHGALNIIAR